jgi:hypothetical protein
LAAAGPGPIILKSSPSADEWLAQQPKIPSKMRQETIGFACPDLLDNYEGILKHIISFSAKGRWVGISAVEWATQLFEIGRLFCDAT